MACIWTITADHINTVPDKNDIGAGSYKGSNPDRDLPYLFRLYDDDGILYYEGRANDVSSQRAFDPLDWATGNAGCTEIRVSENGGRTYETL